MDPSYFSFDLKGTLHFILGRLRFTFQWVGGIFLSTRCLYARLAVLRCNLQHAQGACHCSAVVANPKVSLLSLRCILTILSDFLSLFTKPANAGASTRQALGRFIDRTEMAHRATAHDGKQSDNVIALVVWRLPQLRVGKERVENPEVSVP